MAAHCSFFRSSTAFPTVRTPYCSAVGCALLIPPLVNGISDGSRAVLLSGWQRIAHSFSRQRLFRQFARCIPPRMAAHCSFFRSSMAFPTVRTLYCSSVGSALLIPPLVNGISDSSRAVLLSGRQRIAHYFCRQRLFRRFARRIAWRMAADCSYFCSSTAFTTDTRRIAPRMVADCSYLRSSTAFTTVHAPYCSADGSALLIPPLVNCFHDGSRAVLLSGWQRIAHSSAHQRLP